ncbi:MAG: glycosyltransferase [Candidatus Bathyarchaeia archaeon]|jgi:UDP:flavonoid glycosyltransferase YjiC (YdhE family)
MKLQTVVHSAHLAWNVDMREVRRFTLKVYIAVNGLGLGHIIRCQEIAKELARAGFSIQFATYLDGLDFARRQKLPVVESIPISYHVRSDGSVDLKTTSASSGFSLGVNTFLHQVVREIQNIRRYAPDIIVSDSRLSTVLAARLLRKPVMTILNQYRVLLIHNNQYPTKGLQDKLFLLIARLGWTFFGVLIGELWCLSNAIVVPDLPPPLTVSRSNLAIPRMRRHKVHFVGPIVDANFWKKTDRVSLCQKHGLDKRKKLVYAAVSGPKHERTPLVRKLLPLLTKLPEFNVVVTCGNPAGKTNPKRVGSATVFQWTDNQDDFFRACDTVISRAGHGTILKVMMLGKPLLLIPTPFQTEQLANATSAHSIGGAIVLDQDSLSIKSLRGAITLILRDPYYSRKATRVARVARGFDATTQCRGIIERLVAHQP